MSIAKTTVSDKQQPRSAGHVSPSQKKTGSPEPGAGASRCYDIASSPRQAAQAKVLKRLFPEPVQRKEEELKAECTLQKAAREEKVSDTGSSSGSGIPESVQTRMEKVLNTGLSDVKVHTNSSKASEVGALAFTQGSDIHVAPGQYNPGTSA
ncbi:MAG: DUF4157 domain-containing protein, partial [bacterium]|nr:DUF4157 domain-containing protein [bacterium]